MEREPRYQKQLVDYTSPAWRLLAVTLFFGGVFFFGWAAKIFSLVDQFATFFVITGFFTAAFWAKKRPDKLRRRFGAFGRIALAIQESADEIRETIYSRTIYYGVLIGAGYALLVIVARSLVVAVVMSIYAWQIVAAAGCIVAAVVVAPQFFSAAAKRISVPDDPYSDAREVEGEEIPETLLEAETRPENEEAGEEPLEASASIGYYDEAGNELTPEEFEALFVRGGEEEE